MNSTVSVCGDILLRAVAPHEGPVPRRERASSAPLSFCQEQLWFASREAPELGVSSDLVTIRKRGSIDLDALRRAFNEVVRRHEIWRTSFPVTHGVPVQQVLPAPTYELPLTDLTHLPAADRETRAIRLATEDAGGPYDFERDHLIPARLVRLAEDDHRLYLGLHHMIFDYVSLNQVLMPELVELYGAFIGGRPSPLPELPLQYADFATWQRKQEDTADTALRLDYWRRQLGGELPTIQLPLDHERPLIQGFRGAAEHVDVDREVVSALQHIAQRQGSTLFTLLASAFSVFLHRYSGQDDIVFGTLIDGRSRPELHSMIGFCQNLAALRIDVGGDPTFPELLERVHDVTVGAISNDVPFGHLVQELQPGRDLSRAPLFQAMLTLDPAPSPMDPAWSASLLDRDLTATSVGLSLELSQRPEGHIGCRLTYNSELFEAETIRRMAGHWVRLLEGIVAAPSRSISELPLLGEAERRQLLVEWNATDAEISELCVHKLFEAQVARTPQAVAAVFEERTLTYKELDRRANRLARHLRRLGVQPDVTVALCVERSLEMLVGVLGILKAGGAYVPLDPRYPVERLAYMLEDSAARVLVTQTQHSEALARGTAELVCLDRDAELWAQEPETPPESRVRLEHLAYVIYTSGSTGRPKGVEIPHRALVNFLGSMVTEPGLGADDVLVAVTTLSFDIAGLELYLPLMVGARVVIASAEVAADGKRLSELLESSEASFLQATPATWLMLVESGWAGRPGLTGLCGGEALPRALAGEMLKRCGQLYNVYGPTETTVWSTLARVEAGEPVTIGRPLANTQLYVVARRLEPVPTGVPGELYIGGMGLARGYRNRPELTAERFVKSPFIAGERLYRTGDLARWRADGQVEYLGRLDHQVKVRGFRIELGEIEATLIAHPSVTRAVVLAREDRPGDRRLVAYLVARRAAPEVQELREHLHRSLPDYMVPGAFVYLEQVPLSPNGKVDRNALPSPEDYLAGRSGNGRAPSTELERELAGMVAELLGLERVGMDDNFFMLGGHSLLAAQLVARIRDRFAADIAQISLIQAGTVANLADEVQRLLLSDGGPPEPANGALALVAQPVGSRPTLFFLVADESGLIALRHFIRALGTDQPVVGLVPPRRNRRYERGKGVVELGEALLALIRERQPHGPYVLCGHSLGGVLAYEVAGQLRSRGESVAWLGLLDAATPATNVQSLARDRQLWSRIRRYKARVQLNGLPATLSAMTARQLDLLRASIGLPLGPDQFDYPGVSILMKTYRAVGHDAPLDVFVSSMRSEDEDRPGLGWEGLHRGPLRYHYVPGDHHSILHRPHATVLDIVVRRLNEAQHTLIAEGT